MNLRVMTFNIRNGVAEDGPNAWELRRHLTAQVIRDANVDIIGLQEVFDFQLEYLLNELPDFESYSVGRDDGVAAGEHCSILWRKGLFTKLESGTFWLSDTPNVPNSMTWGNRITRICSWVKFAEGFIFYNTHWDHESELARHNGAQLIARQLPAEPWILVGDLNAEPDWREVAPISRLGKVNFVTKGNSTATFHDFFGGSIGDHIDHIFSSYHFVAENLKVLVTPRGGVYPSDHYPVIVDLNLA